MSIAVLVDANMIDVATRGCSVGKGSEQLASQRESRDMSKKPRHNCCMSFFGGGHA